jgi:hypothetical protein
MSSPSNGEAESPSFQPFTKAERIQQLNDIDKVSLHEGAAVIENLTACRA